MLINYLLIAVSAFLFNLLCLSIIKKSAFKYNMLVFHGVPHIGGIAIGISFILVSLTAFFIKGIFPKEALGIIVAASAMLISGIIDDIWELSVAAKFAFQIIAVFLLIFCGVKTQIVYIGDIPNILITLFWVLGITNAFNHLDVMDGLAGGTAAIISLAFVFLSILSQDIKIIILALSLVGAILSFLIYNLPPAKIYMGNSGSHLLGFVLASVALIISYAPMEKKIALLSPILILGLPIFDTAFLILMRIKKDKSIFKKSNDHMALRFLKKGYSKYRTLSVMLGYGLLCSISGVALTQVTFFLSLVIIGLIILIGLIITRNMSRVAING
ncbi:MAG: MraY family glycosyltransferase [Candidatus Omnitrophica bacterium]|nr:MraY family glycosyltransferase [Candidatus Omnitrophota bacterium]